MFAFGDMNDGLFHGGLVQDFEAGLGGAVIGFAGGYLVGALAHSAAVDAQVQFEAQLQLDKQYFPDDSAFKLNTPADLTNGTDGSSIAYDANGSPYVRASGSVYGGGDRVDYYDVSNFGEERTGGTLAWRDNNPGNMRISGQEIGFNMSTRGRFAIFPDYQTGFNAMEGELQSPAYSGLSITGAITKWAPPNENPTAVYLSYVANHTGFDMTRLVGSLNSGELNTLGLAIQHFEGWTAGTVMPTSILENP